MEECIMKKKSSWGWYAIKLLFESTISGEPNIDNLDENYSNNVKLYEEQIIVVRAQSVNHAFKQSDSIGKREEMTYSNDYDQTVQLKFIDSINCQKLFDDNITSGTEIYSVLYEKPLNTETENFIKMHIPEAVHNEESKKPLYNFLINE
jgi:hypothetical protein